MSWVRRLRAIIDRSKKNTDKKKHNIAASASSHKRSKKDRNRKHRKLARLQRQRTARQ